MRKLSIEKLLSDKSHIKLEKQNDFLLHLYNDNYSPETVYNYNRDLSFFAEYLHESNVKFEDISKLTITYFKGWIKERYHIHKKEEVSQVSDESDDSPTSKDASAVKQGKATTLPEKPAVKQNSRVQKSVSQGSSYKGGYVKNNNPEMLDANSINRILVSLRNYLRFLVEYDYPAPLASDAVQLVRVPKKKPQVPTLEEVISLVESPTFYETKEMIALRNRAMMELLMASGMRISELVSLNRNQLNSEGKLFITGKGRKQRFVYLTPRATEHLMLYLSKRTDSHQCVFLPERGSRLGGSDPRVSTNYLQMKIAEYRRNLGIIVPISAHTIRHAYATYLAENGANPAAIQILLGHESLQTTTRYVHASDKFAEETHREYHPVSK